MDRGGDSGGKRRCTRYPPPAARGAGLGGPMNLVDLFRISFAGRAERGAIQFQSRTLTYGELDAASERVAHVFRRLGLGKGDRVALYLGNSIELVLAHLASLKLGLVTVPMNIQY